MKFISVISAIKDVGQFSKLEILHYISCIAQPVFYENPLDWEVKLLSKVKECFGPHLELEYVDRELKQASVDDHGLVIRVIDNQRCLH